MISRKKLVNYLRTLPEYSVEAEKPHVYIVQDSIILGEILADSTDYGAVIQILDNRAPHLIRNLLCHFKCEVIHVDHEYTQYTSVGQYIIKLLDFKV